MRYIVRSKKLMDYCSSVSLLVFMDGCSFLNAFIMLYVCFFGRILTDVSKISNYLLFN
jgi:hypothetical protein